MTFHDGDRHDGILQSEIRSMTIECHRVGGINCAQGVCDMKVPAPVLAGAREAMDAGINSYTRYDGRPELREAIAGFYDRHYTISVDPEREIVVTAGATGAMYCACLALLHPGDEFIVFEPYYGYHVNTIVSLGMKPVFVPMRPRDWTVTEEDIRNAVTPQTHAIMINTPANPSGKVFSADEIAMIGRIAEQNGLFIFTDEIYEHFLYDGAVHRSPLGVAALRERTIAIAGLSKTFSITGWRIGYCICDAKWATTIGLFNDLIYVCAPAPLQMGAARGLAEMPVAFYRDVAAKHGTKRDKLCSALSAAGLSPIVPRGSYYVLADFSPIPGTSGRERALNFLSRTGIAVVPGNAFYHDASGETLARFCFAKEDSVIDEVCRRIAAARR